MEISITLTRGEIGGYKKKTMFGDVVYQMWYHGSGEYLTGDGLFECCVDDLIALLQDLKDEELNEETLRPPQLRSL